ncbi:MAG: helix-turn-helix transcriptional regulator, partial [Candidatus Sulfotelmatobacter sp.]
MRTENHPARRSSAVGAFGEKLRKQREQRGIALDAISNTTKISTRMLRAIEEEHFDQLPGGVFNKGFVRAYARQVGLNEEEAITDYLTALRESQIAAQTVPPNFRAQPGKPSAGSDSRNHEPGRNNFPSHDVLKNDGLKPDLLRNDLLKNDLHKNNLRKEDIQRNDFDRNNGPAESGRNKNTQPIPRLSADRRRKDRRDDRRNNEDQRNQDRRNQDQRNEDGRNRARSAENLLARALHSPNQHPRPDNAEPVVSPPAEDSPAQVPWGKLAAVLLLLTLALALWSLHRRSQATRAAQTAAQTTAKTAPSPLPSAASSTTPVQVPVQPAASSTPLTAGKALSTGNLVTASAPNS